MDSDNLLIVALKQLDAIPKEVVYMNQLTDDLFINSVISISNKVSIAKGFQNFKLPQSISKDTNTKYRECQKLVEFIKSTGYKQPINLNNLLFPSGKEINNILEYLVELLSKEDQQTETMDYSEKNFPKLKQGKKLKAFISENWVLPELNSQSYVAQSNGFGFKMCSFSSSKMICLDKNTLKLIKRKAQGIQIDEKLKKFSQEKTQELYENSINVKLYSNDDFIVSNELLKNFEKNIEQAKKITKILNLKEQTKTSDSQQWGDILLQRTKGILFHTENYIDNNFISKVKLHRDRKMRIESITTSNEELEFQSNLNISITSSKNNFEISSVSNNISSNNTNAFTFESGKGSSVVLENNQDNRNSFNEEIITKNHQKSTTVESKIRTQLKNKQNNFEKEKEELMLEIDNLNKKLENLANQVNEKSEEKEKISEEIIEKNEIIQELNKKNQSVLVTIESKLDALENLEKLKNNKLKEEEIENELQQLEQKHKELISNWNIYSNQMNFQLNSVKEEVETKKKEYNYKYDKITQLKKEIEEMGNKTAQKSELKNFLKEEFDKIPVEVNRNKYISKISELTSSLTNEKEKWGKYLSEIKSTETELEKSIEIIKKIDNELEDKMFQDAKSNSSLKDGYAIFIKIRENYNIIQKNMIDTTFLKDKIRETENKLEDYRIRLKNYDIDQLRNGVNSLKNENKKK